MKKNGMFMPSDIPAITYNKSEPTQNGHQKPDAQLKALTNGHNSTPKSRRLNSNTDSKTNRRTSKERYNDVTITSKNSARIQ